MTKTSLILKFSIFALLSFICLWLYFRRSAACFSSTRYSNLPGRPRSKLNIAVVTYYTEDQVGRSLKYAFHTSKIKYCKSHGYTLFDGSSNIEMKNLIEKTRPFFVNKYYYKYVSMMHVLLNETSEDGRPFDWVIWLDGDALYLNFEKRYEDIIDERFDIILSTDLPENDQVPIVNAGSFIVRNSEFGIRFLNDTLKFAKTNCAFFLDNYPNAKGHHIGAKRLCEADGIFWEWDQGIIQGLLTFETPEYVCHFKKSWHRAFNSLFPFYEQGDFVLHFAGWSKSGKAYLAHMINRVIRSKDGRFHKFIDSQSIRQLASEPSFTNDLYKIEERYDSINKVCG